MNYSKFTLITFLLVITTTFLAGQDPGTNYKHSRITLSSGEIIKVKNLNLTDSIVSYVEQAIYRKYDLNEIQSIETATKSHWLTGMLVGAGVGIGTTIGVTAAAQAPRDADGSPNEIPWWSDGYTYSNSGSGGTLTYDMAFAPQFLIFTTITGIGTLVGVGIKKGWVEVFPGSTSMVNRFDLNLTAVNCLSGFKPGLHFTYRF